MIFLEKCLLLVDRLGHTSECYIEVQQKKGGGRPGPLGPPSGYAPEKDLDCCTIFFSFTVLLQNTIYTRVQVERVYKLNPIFEAKNTTFLEKV